MLAHFTLRKDGSIVASLPAGDDPALSAAVSVGYAITEGYTDAEGHLHVRAVKQAWLIDVIREPGPRSFPTWLRYAAAVSAVLLVALIVGVHVAAHT